MTLIDLVRVVGTCVAVTGAILTAPAAFGVHVRRAHSALNAAGRGMRRLIPWLRPTRQAVTVHAGSAAGTMTFGTTLAIGHVRPAVNAPTNEQIAALWRRVEQAESDARSLRAHVDERDAAIGARLDEQIARVEGAIDAVRAAMRDRDRRALEIDVRGLPVIAAGIVLTGLPDSWIGHHWLAWPLLVVAVTLAIFETSQALSSAPSEA